MTDPAAFLRCLEKGLGRAHLILQSEDPAPFREVLRSACLEDPGFFTVSATERAQYFFELIALSGEPGFFLPGIIGELQTPGPEQHWTDRQFLFGLLRRFAVRGFGEAREAMYSALSRFDYESQSATELVRLDGEQGLAFAGEQLLRCGSDNLSSEQFDLLAALRETDPAAFERQRTQPAAPWVSAALAEHSSFTIRDAACEPPPNKPYAEIRRRILEEDKSVVGLAIWGERATESELLLAADDLLLETEPERLLHYLRIFSARPFPHGHEAILPLARHEDEKVAWAAVMALSWFTHPHVRALGEEFSLQADRRCESIRLLARNSRPEDYALIEEWLDVELDYSDYHGLTFAATAYIEANLVPAAAASLIHLYEHGACEYCRERVVQHLLSLNCLPDWMRAECRYDAVAGIRALMGAKTPAPAE